MKQLFLILLLSSCVTGTARSESWIGADGPTYKVMLQNGGVPYRTGLIAPKDWGTRKIANPLPKLRGTLPAKFDWMDKVTPIRNQGNCGSCWSFSAQASIADVINIHRGIVLDLSEQFPVSCDKESSGCNGGWPTSAFELIRLKGNVLEKDMPYTQTTGRCPSDLLHMEKVAGWKELSQGVATIDAIKQAIWTYGPVSVAVSASGDFMNYKSGIYNSAASGPVNHAVNLVGWDDTVKPGHWIMRNSWGTSWGEKGFMRIAYGSKKIGYATSYVDMWGPVPHGEPTPNPTPVPTPTVKPTPTPSPTPGPNPPTPDCEPCTFIRWLAYLFGV